MPMMISLLTGGVLALLSAIILLLLASVAISKCLLPESMSGQIVIFVSVISAFAGGIFARKGWSRKKLIAGILVGVILYLLQTAIGLLAYSGGEITPNGIGNMIGCICGGGAAGLVSPRKGKRTKRRK